MVELSSQARDKWSSADDAQLLALYATTSAQQIAAVLGRTTDAVLERARQIGARKYRRTRG